MNPSYGDSTNSAHGRARVPGPDVGQDGYGEGPYDQYDQYDARSRAAPRSPATGSARAGRASVGAASPTGRASVRLSGGHGDGGYSGSSGRASVPGVTGSAAVGSASVGSASVGSAAVPSAAGRASVGRASVGGGSGGPDGPGGRRDRQGAGGKRPKNRKTRRRNLILSGFALIIMLCGLLVVGGTYYFDGVKMPDQLPTPNQSTTIYYSDGTTQMAKLGDQNRTIIPLDQVPKDVQHAVVAAEDGSFYTNAGVDFKGVLRAAWNNVTGGNRQGASTITQQYARNMADLEGISYARKLREAVIAMKLDQNYSKDQILAAYLNTVYFGRGAYGIEAAAQAYFGPNKHAQNLTLAEGMVLASCIKQPEPDPTDPKGSPGYDPNNSLQNATDRWNYVKNQLVKLKFVSPADAAKLQYPTDWVKPNAATTSAAQYGLDTPTGFVVHHVMDELSHQTDVKLPDLKNNGYKIITTIDVNMERAAIDIASPAVKGSVMSTQPSNLEAGLVAIQPGTGRVLAYYGGSDNGSGLDYAGIYSDPVLDDGTWTGANAPPGSTFKLYTLATALSKGISIDSYWYGPPSMDFPGRDEKSKAAGGPGPVTNADGAADSCPAATNYVCTLQQALQQSMNTVFYGVGYKVGADNIIDMAKAMGVKHLWAPVTKPDENDPTGKKMIQVNQRFDLSQYTGKDLAPKYFGTEISIGQYGTTVLDNATGVATLAARGVEVDTHFVSKVYKGSALVYQERFKINKLSDTVGMTQQEVDDETWAMRTVIDNGPSKNRLANGRQAAAKTGTWQLNDTEQNAHAWYAGFTPQLATVVHIGSKDPTRPQAQYYDANHRLQNMNGANTPGDVWKKFMDAALKDMPKVPLPQPKHVGDPTAGNAPSPTPAAPPPSQDGNGDGNGNGNGNNCVNPFFCQPTTAPSPGGGGQGGGTVPATKPARRP